MSTAIASRYARALADLAFGGKTPVDADALAGELDRFLAEYEAAPALREVLSSPAVVRRQKLSVVGTLADRLGLSTVTKHFLFVVAEHGRVSVLPAVREVYGRLIDERRGIIRADIVSAVALSGEERALLESELGEKLKRPVRAVYTVDAKIIGGAIVRVGSEVYDGSVRGKLAVLAAQLTA